MDKRDEIIITAQKKFGQFGYKKTSMLEIAEELGISKGLLYYYFPDKESLYVSIVEKEFGEFKSKIEQQLGLIDDPFEILRTYVRLRLVNFNTLLNFGRFNHEEMLKFSKVRSKTQYISKEYERKIIVQTLKKGIDKGLVANINPEETAELLSNSLLGIRIAVIKNKQLYYLNDTEFNDLVKKNEAFIELFISGLKYNAQKLNQD